MGLLAIMSNEIIFHTEPKSIIAFDFFPESRLFDISSRRELPVEFRRWLNRIKNKEERDSKKSLLLKKAVLPMSATLNSGFILNKMTEANQVSS